MVIEARNKENLVLTKNLAELEPRFHAINEENNNFKRRLGEFDVMGKNLHRLTD